SRLWVRRRLLPHLPDQVGGPGFQVRFRVAGLTGQHLFDQLVKDGPARRTAKDGGRGNLSRFRNFGAFDLGFPLADLIEFAPAWTAPGHGLAAGEYRGGLGGEDLPGLAVFLRRYSSLLRGADVLKLDRRQIGNAEIDELRPALVRQ